MYIIPEGTTVTFVMNGFDKVSWFCLAPGYAGAVAIETHVNHVTRFIAALVLG